MALDAAIGDTVYQLKLTMSAIARKRQSPTLLRKAPNCQHLSATYHFVGCFFSPPPSIEHISSLISPDSFSLTFSSNAPDATRFEKISSQKTRMKEKEHYVRL